MAPLKCGQSCHGEHTVDCVLAVCAKVGRTPRSVRRGTSDGQQPAQPHPGGQQLTPATSDWALPGNSKAEQPSNGAARATSTVAASHGARQFQEIRYCRQPMSWSTVRYGIGWQSTAIAATEQLWSSISALAATANRGRVE